MHAWPTCVLRFRQHPCLNSTIRYICKIRRTLQLEKKERFINKEECIRNSSIFEQKLTTLLASTHHALVIVTLMHVRMYVCLVVWQLNYKISKCQEITPTPTTTIQQQLQHVVAYHLQCFKTTTPTCDCHYTILSHYSCTTCNTSYLSYLFYYTIAITLCKHLIQHVVLLNYTTYGYNYTINYSTSLTTSITEQVRNYNINYNYTAQYYHN